MPGNKGDTGLFMEIWEDNYRKNSRGWLRVSSDSMMPLIHTGDSVLITPVAPSDIRPGDVIIFRREERLIVHRVLIRRSAPEGFMFIERGDGLKARGQFTSKDVFGQAAAIRHGDVYYGLDSPSGKLAARFLSGWFRLSSPFLEGRMRTSKNFIVRGIVLPVRGVNKLLVRICCLVWRSAGKHHLPASG